MIVKHNFQVSIFGNWRENATIEEVTGIHVENLTFVTSMLGKLVSSIEFWVEL